MTNSDAIHPPHAIVLAGGFGTRLRTRVSDRPKALAEVSGKPFLAYQMDWLMQQGIRRVTLATHYMSEQLDAFISEWDDSRIRIDSVRENEPLGTGGAVINAIEALSISGTVLVLNGDTLYKCALDGMFNSFRQSNAAAMLMASSQDDASRFGTVIVQDNYVTDFKQAVAGSKKGLVNAGVYLFDASLFESFSLEPCSMEKQLFPDFALKRQLMAFVVEGEQMFFDIGTPEAFDELNSGGWLVAGS